METISIGGSQCHPPIKMATIYIPRTDFRKIPSLKAPVCLNLSRQVAGFTTAATDLRRRSHPRPTLSPPGIPCRRSPRAVRNGAPPTAPMASPPLPPAGPTPLPLPLHGPPEGTVDQRAKALSAFCSATAATLFDTVT